VHHRHLKNTVNPYSIRDRRKDQPAPSSTNESFIIKKRAKKKLTFCIYEWKNEQSIALNYFVMKDTKGNLFGERIKMQ